MNSSARAFQIARLQGNARLHTTYMIQTARGLYFLSQALQYRRIVNADQLFHHLARGLTVTLRTLLQLVLTIGVCGTFSNVWAYDASPYAPGSTDPCTQVYFSAFTPTPFSAEKNNVAVAPKSEFSFLASKTTNWPTITVKIKEEKVPVTVTTITNGYLVKGKLPESAKGRYIRVEVFAKGPSDCDKADGWLLKVGN